MVSALDGRLGVVSTRPAGSQRGIARSPGSEILSRWSPVRGDATRRADAQQRESRMTVKKTAQRQGFKTGEAIVYPAHGVGRITAIEEQEIAGFKLELFVVAFEKDKMVLRVPTAKAITVGMRKLAEPKLITRSLEVLTGR